MSCVYAVPDPGCFDPHVCQHKNMCKMVPAQPQGSARWQPSTLTWSIASCTGVHSLSASVRKSTDLHCFFSRCWKTESLAAICRAQSQWHLERGPKLEGMQQRHFVPSAWLLQASVSHVLREC